MSTANRERYWLLKRGRCRSPAADERRVLDDFVCCEVPVEGDAAVALEVFTSREGAEAELRGMEILAARGGLLREARQSGGRFASGEFAKMTSEEVIELLEAELLEILEGSEVAYVLIDPPPVDGPIPGSLGLKAAPAFAGELRRHLLKTIHREHV
jgi:hypothetical protein